MRTKLSINLNKVALLRNQRDVGYPNPVAAGRTILKAGAHGLTVHPRPDQRHIRNHDVTDLATMLEGEGWRAKGIEFNIEGNPFPEWMDLCRTIGPDQATLVPDAPEASTSNCGWNTADSKVQARLRPLIADLKAIGCRVSLFMNPEPELMAAAAELGADRVELYTEPWARAYGTTEEDEVLAAYGAAAAAARDVGLALNAGHDLTTANLPTFHKTVPDLAEVSIGHAFTSDALWLGFEGAVKAYLAALRGT